MDQGKITEELMDAIMQEMVGSYQVSQGTLAKLSVPPTNPVTGIIAPPTGTGSSSQLNSVSLPPSLRISSGRDVERSGSSSWRRSRSPRSRRSRSPRSRRSRSPRSRRSRSPRSPIRRSESDRSYAPLLSGHLHHSRPSDRSQIGDKRVESSSSKGMSERGDTVFDKERIEYPTSVEEEENYLKAIMTETNAVSKLGVHLIRWAGFHSMRGNEFIKSTLPQCQLKTEACAKMVASFKSSLKSEHKTHCLRYVGNLRHPALSAPCLDEEFLNLMVEKGAVASRQSFYEVINPLDNHLQTFQNNLLKCAHPMFLACNEYELNLKPGSDTRAQLFTALEKTISLCRKTLVLLGLSYSATSAFRQEKIMEAVELQKVAPVPSNFPNLEDSFLFGKKYMTKLRKWLNDSKHPVQVTYNLFTPEQKQQQVLQGKPRKGKGKNIVEPMAIQMIDYLLEYNVKNWSIKGRDAVKPPFWFLFDETSEEYKYYRLKMCEMQKLKRATMDANTEANAYQRTPEDLANESVRAMILAKKIKAVKKRFRKDLPFQRKKKRIIKRTIGTQSELDAPLIQKQSTTFEESSSRQEPLEAASSDPVAFPDQPNAPQTCESSKNTDSPISSTSVASKSSVNLQYSEVEACTKETAENLALFLVEMGHKLVGFDLKILHNKPKFWFLKERESAAFKFYYMKFTEFRQARGLSYDPHKSEVNSEDSEPRISKSLHSNATGGNIFIGSDSEINEFEHSDQQVISPLVTFCSEDDSSDDEHEIHQLQEHTLLKEAEKPPSLLMKLSSTDFPKPQTTFSPDQKSVNLHSQDGNFNPLVSEAQNPMDKDLTCEVIVAQKLRSYSSGIQNPMGTVQVTTVMDNPSGICSLGEKGTTPIDPKLIESEASSLGFKEVHNLDIEEMEIGEPAGIDTSSGKDARSATVKDSPCSAKM